LKCLEVRVVVKKFCFIWGFVFYFILFFLNVVSWFGWIVFCKGVCVVVF
jgi:hypothetical protein